MEISCCEYQYRNYSGASPETAPGRKATGHIWGQSEAAPPHSFTAWVCQDELQVQGCILMPLTAVQRLSFFQELEQDSDSLVKAPVTFWEWKGCSVSLLPQAQVTALRCYSTGEYKLSNMSNQDKSRSFRVLEGIQFSPQELILGFLQKQYVKWPSTWVNIFMSVFSYSFEVKVVPDQA